MLLLGGCSYARSVESYLENLPIAIAQTDNQEQARTYTREVTATRILSPVGVSPGETISRQEGISISNKGFNAGGSKWSWVDSLWQTIKNWFWGLMLIAIALLLLPLIFPALVPIANVILSGIGRFISWCIPLVGGIVEALKRKATNKVCRGLIESQEAYKERIGDCDALDDDEKALILSTLKIANNESQDGKTQKTVDRIKGEA